MHNVERIFYNGTIATVDNKFTFAKAVAVADGKVFAVGTNEEILAVKSSETELINLDGALMLPGLCDAHLHASDYVHNLDHLACDHFLTIDEIKSAIAEWLRMKETKWLIGNGILQELLDLGINRYDLDEVAPETPVVLIMWHGHGCVANSAALKINGVTADTPDPPGGIIRRFENGEPTGVMEEASALQLMFTNMPSFTPEQIAEKLKRMQHIMNSMGYTSYTESTAGPANDLREGGASGRACLKAYLMLLESGEMTCRVSVGTYSGRGGKQSYEILKEDLENGVVPTSPDPDWLSFHMLKFFCDGVETSHTAWMKQDYADAPGNRGESCIGENGSTEEEQITELRKMLKLTHDSGYQIGIHTVGNRAVYESLEAILAAKRENPGNQCRHYLIHADNFGDAEDIKRCAENDIVISSQPGLAVNMFIRDAECVGQELSDRMMPLRNVINSGVVLAGGSDSIAGDYCDWRGGIQAAVLRKTPEGTVHHPEYAITVEDAVRMFTINHAYQEMAETKRGSIESGKFADFTIVDKNIFEIPPEEISEVKVLRTVVGGKTVYIAE